MYFCVFNGVLPEKEKYEKNSHILILVVQSTDVASQLKRVVGIL